MAAVIGYEVVRGSKGTSIGKVYPVSCTVVDVIRID